MLVFLSKTLNTVESFRCMSLSDIHRISNTIIANENGLMIRKISIKIIGSIIPFFSFLLIVSQIVLENNDGNLLEKRLYFIVEGVIPGVFF
jgi:hypothetical protein